MDVMRRALVQGLKQKRYSKADVDYFSKECGHRYLYGGPFNEPEKHEYDEADEDPRCNSFFKALIHDSWWLADDLRNVPQRQDEEAEEEARHSPGRKGVKCEKTALRNAERYLQWYDEALQGGIADKLPVAGCVVNGTYSGFKALLFAVGKEDSIQTGTQKPSKPSLDEVLWGCNALWDATSSPWRLPKTAEPFYAQ